MTIDHFQNIFPSAIWDEQFSWLAVRRATPHEQFDPGAAGLPGRPPPLLWIALGGGEAPDPARRLEPCPLPV